jgi:hypothetical protein
MANTPTRRRNSWNRSLSDSRNDGFGRIKSVGVAVAFGLPLIAMGAFALVAAIGAGGSFLWILAGGLVVVGLVAALSHKII